MPEPQERNVLKFDWTMNLGHLMMILTMVLAAVAAYATARVTLSEHEARISALEIGISSVRTTSSDLTATLYTIRQDVAVIRDRMDRGRIDGVPR